MHLEIPFGLGVDYGGHIGYLKLFGQDEWLDVVDVAGLVR
jgi:hypothetical protein